jgi:hypothetical protein
LTGLEASGLVRAGSSVSASLPEGNVLILIDPVEVISTAEIGKPAASTPAMARTMSPGVKRRGPSFLFLFGILRVGTRCHATSTDLIATVVCCSGVPKFRRAIMSFDTCGI